MVRHRPTDPNQIWMTFLQSHLAATAACDFSVVPTVTFQRLFCFVVMSVDRWRILHTNVTKQPTAEWTAQPLVEAFTGDQWMPRFLQRDRDGIYDWAFRPKLEAFGIEPLASAPRSPGQNTYVERVIGSIRRECTDHITPLGERHLLRALRQDQAYLSESRTHYSLDRNAAIARQVQAAGEVIATPVLGGLHHRYSLAA